VIYLTWRSLVLVFFTGIIVFASSASWGQETKRIRLASSTSLVSSGFLSYLLPIYSNISGIEFELFPVGSGLALRLGHDGEVDMVWTHAPEEERHFMAKGAGVSRHEIMRNDFILIGPGDDPASVRKTKDIEAAMRVIAQSHADFVSRADDSGTHKRERQLWQRAGIDPYAEDWYIELGSGMRACLVYAEEKQAYMLVDRATFHVAGDGRLAIIKESDPDLKNVYSVVHVNPKISGAKDRGASRAFIDWLISSEGQAVIADYRVAGKSLFIPVVGDSR